MNINRAQLILDYLYVLGERARNEIEGMTTTLYRITPHSMEGNNSGDDEWMGRIKFMTRMHKETREKIDQVQKEVNDKIDEAQEMNVKMNEKMNGKMIEMNGKIDNINQKIDENFVKIEKLLRGAEV